MAQSNQKDGSQSADTSTLEALRKLYAHDPTRLRILDVVNHNAVQKGDHGAISSVPWINGAPLDISKLFMCTVKSGGFERVELRNDWAALCTQQLGLNISAQPNLPLLVRECYLRTLLSFERQINASKRTQPEKASSAAPPAGPVPASATATAAPGLQIHTPSAAPVTVTAAAPASSVTQPLSTAASLSQINNPAKKLERAHPALSPQWNLRLRGNTHIFTPERESIKISSWNAFKSYHLDLISTS